MYVHVGLCMGVQVRMQARRTESHRDCSYLELRAALHLAPLSWSLQCLVLLVVDAGTETLLTSRSPLLSQEFLITQIIAVL